MDLKFIAFDFYDRNCVGCAHRKPVRRPNLSELVHERDQAAASAAESAHRDAAEAAELQVRDAKRHALRAELDPPSANVIDQIEELDHQRRGAAADRLAETAKLAPDVFTPPLVEYLFGLIEAGESWFDNAGLRVLAALSVDRARLVRCALFCIPRIFAAKTAIEILLGNIEFADEPMIGGAVPELISMANPRRSPLAGDGRRPNPAPLLRVYEVFPRAIESAIAALLDGSDPYEVGRAARGISVLGDRDPSLPVRFARPLIGKFLRDRRLLRASENYSGDGDGETLGELRLAAALAFEAAPAEIDQLLQAFLAGASEVADARVISIYREVLGRPQFEDKAEVTEGSRLALGRAVWRATETNSQEVLRGIFDLTSGSPWGLRRLAAAEVRHLLGAAILIEDKARRSSDPSPIIEEQLSLAALERANRLRLQRDLRDRFIAWATAGAGQTTEGTDVYLEVLAGLPSDTDDPIKVDMVGHLHELMQTTEGITGVLPQLYTALVGGSVALRANAVRAIGELRSRQQDKMPRLVFEAFMVLLRDPYRMVHKFAVYALRRTSLPDEFKSRAKAGLLYQLACYMGDRQDDHFFVDCLAFYLAGYATPEERAGKFGTWAIALLEKIEPWYVAREIRTLRRSLRENDRYVELLIRLVGDAQAWDIYHEELTRALADLPAQSVYAHYAADTSRRIPRFDEERDETEPPPTELTVAFIRFTIDGKAAADTDFLTPKEIHDLEIEVRISRWPDAAEALTLAPVTIEARSSHDFPVFRFPRPTGDPPYHLRERGRAVLHVAQGVRAQPFEFRYAADFEPSEVEQPVAVVGHRNLRLNGIDRPITGYEGVDRRLLEIRDELRQRPLVTAGDVTNTLMLVAALGSLTGQAVQDNLFPKPLKERELQNYVRGYLRQRPEIGPRLEEHPRAAGGETDLSFARIRLELKSENGRPLRLADCQQFVGQTSTYAAGSDKRVAVLCVLDGSRKVKQPFPADEGIGILRTDDDAVAVVTLLIQGNLARPSDLSRRRRPGSPSR